MTNAKALKLYTHTKMFGLDSNSKYKPAKPGHYTNSVFEGQHKCSTPSAPSNNGLMDLANILSVLTAGLGIFKAVKDLTGATNNLKNVQNPNGAEQNGAKDTLSALRKAQNSVDVKELTAAIEQGKKESGTLGTQIKEADDTANTAKQDMDAAQGNYNKLDETNNGLKEKVQGEKSSASLSVQQGQLETQLSSTPETIDGVPNPLYGELKGKIEKIKTQIEEAKKIEAQIKENEGTLKTYKEVIDAKKKIYDTNSTKSKELKGQQTKIDTEVKNLEKKLADVQNATKPADTNTTTAVDPAANTTGAKKDDPAVTTPAALTIDKFDAATQGLITKYGIDIKQYKSEAEVKTAITAEQNKIATQLGQDIEKCDGQTGTSDLQNRITTLGSEGYDVKSLQSALDAKINEAKNKANQTQGTETKKYTVKQGQALWMIAQELHVNINDLYQANKKQLNNNPNHIEPGWELVIPEKKVK